MRIVASIGVFCLLAAGCNKDNSLDCFKSAGPQHVQARYPGSFSNIYLADKMDLYIAQGNEASVKVEAGRNLFRSIRTEVRNDTLFLANDNMCNFVRGYKHTIKIFVTLPKVKRVINTGVGTVRFEPGFTQDTMVVRAESSGDIHVAGTFRQIRTSSHGNGDIYLEGSCNSLYVYTYGTNFLQAKTLSIRDYAFVETLSIGSCYLNGNGLARLECNIWSEGNVYYSGKPGVIADYSDGSGRGRLIQD